MKLIKALRGGRKGSENSQRQQHKVQPLPSTNPNDSGCGTTTAMAMTMTRRKNPAALTSMKSNKPDGSYIFTFPRHRSNCWNVDGVDDTDDLPIFGGEKTLVRGVANGSRCLLKSRKGKTEAILIRNVYDRSVHICSFTPRGDGNESEKFRCHDDTRGGCQQLSLFEWGVVTSENIKINNGKTKINKESECSIGGRRRRRYRLKTPHDDGCFLIEEEICDELIKDAPPSRMEITNQNTGEICATFIAAAEDKETTDKGCNDDDDYKCRASIGVDPAMMVCFVVSVDAVRAMMMTTTAGTSSSKSRFSMLSSSSRKGEGGGGERDSIPNVFMTSLSSSVLLFYSFRRSKQQLLLTGRGGGKSGSGRNNGSCGSSQGTIANAAISSPSSRTTCDTNIADSKTTRNLSMTSLLPNSSSGHQNHNSNNSVVVATTKKLLHQQQPEKLTNAVTRPAALPSTISPSVGNHKNGYARAA